MSDRSTIDKKIVRFAIAAIIALLTAFSLQVCSFADTSEAGDSETGGSGSEYAADSSEETVSEETIGEETIGEEAAVQDGSPPARAKVVKILSNDIEETEYFGESFTLSTQIIEVLILNGPHKGETIKAEHSLNFGISDKQSGLLLDAGDEVLLYLDESEDGLIRNAYVSEVVKDRYLLWLAIGFMLLLIIVGRLKGLKSIISLALTCAAVIFVLLPMILKGYDPVLVTVVVCTVVITLTLVIISGANRKTLAAIIGTTGGVLTAGLIAYTVGSLAKLTGLGDEESQMLMYIPQNINFDFKGLLFAGIIIGALGAVMDVGMSIASSMHEIKANTPAIKKWQLIKAGMNIGRDIMGTMSNTLILAYAGGAMQLLLLFMAYKVPFTEIINRDIIASEVVRALAGSIGLIFTIPLTAITAGMLSQYKVRENSRHDQGIDYRY